MPPRERTEARPGRSAEAAMRAEVGRLLATYDYPPDLEDAAVDLVLEQAEQYALEA